MVLRTVKDLKERLKKFQKESELKILQLLKEEQKKVDQEYKK